MDIGKALAINLKYLMAQYDTNAAKTARTTGISANAISMWLGENRLPRVDYVNKLADCFAVTTDFLTGRSGEKYSNGVLLRLEHAVVNEILDINVTVAGEAVALKDEIPPCYLDETERVTTYANLETRANLVFLWQHWSAFEKEAAANLFKNNPEAARKEYEAQMYQRFRRKHAGDPFRKMIDLAVKKPIYRLSWTLED